MSIDWAHFTPWTALLGGVLIGLAAVALAVFLGRIAGVSGIVGGLLMPQSVGERAWRWMFVLGLLAAPWLYRVFAPYPAVTVEAGTPWLILAGLLVGVGTRYGAGCTSGHGICGVSRGSPRSVVATLCFMAAGFAAVYVLRHVVKG